MSILNQLGMLVTWDKLEGPAPKLMFFGAQTQLHEVGSSPSTKQAERNPTTRLDVV